MLTKRYREVDSLFSIYQKDEESFKDYVARFKVATLEVHNMDKSMIMLALKRGLHPSHFTYLLDKIFSKFYSEMLARTQYTYANERALTRWEIDRKPNEKQSQEEPGKA